MNNKTSDKNVRNIERCEQLTKPEHANWIGISNQLAISHILAELEQKDERIKALEEERDHWHGCFIVAMENSIPKQVVIDEINEINKKYEDGKNENGENPYFYPNFTIKTLQKLLEGEK